MKAGWIKTAFLLAGLYDVALALAFLFFSNPIMERFGVEPPNHPAYIQFPALLVLIFAAMYLRIASDPFKHRGLIVYGAGLKVAFAATTFWSQATIGVPAMWVPLAWADLAFLGIFLLAWKSLARPEPQTQQG